MSSQLVLMFLLLSSNKQIPAGLIFFMRDKIYVEEKGALQGGGEEENSESQNLSVFGRQIVLKFKKLEGGIWRISS